MNEQPPLPESRLFRWMSRGVVALTLVSLLVFVIQRGVDDLGTLAVASFAVWFSKIAIFASELPAELGVERPWFNPWQLAYISWVLDLIAAVILARVERFHRLPFIGGALQRGHERAGQILLEFPGIRRLAFAGVFLYVFIPFPASGALTGTLISRLIGQTRAATLIAVGAGAGIAVMLYAALAVFLGARWRSLIASPWLAVAGLAVLGLFAWWAWVRVRRELERG